MIHYLIRQLEHADCLPTAIRQTFDKFPPCGNSRIDTGYGVSIIIHTADFQCRFSPDRRVLTMAQENGDCGAISIKPTLCAVVFATMLQIAGIPSVGDTVANLDNRYCVASIQPTKNEISVSLVGIDIPGFYSVPIAKLMSEFFIVSKGV